ncbi:LLM class flavin-dependent oxidoreductase [Paracraurococcus lichenis]|uniref:LLM class flavin-dependent oxidoreductase n=1 Tax=Paracraurococcus lichenis TaxID=3064888 RepID=A0ABT9DY70_9PROT|nr:LLM class flavin-dependent oxidoreductase [Paracraurococcus sp. LOR1-02]MDO9708831.1 LLM class flavin-dependent oxidoreductase [Paracraurococcus sp. LOR1-02]
MQFGIFDQNDRGALDLTAHYEARLRLAEFYDQAGFDRYHVSEHHATPLSATPATGAWLGALAQRTKRIRFGPLVYILPLRHPLQIAEEVCLLDQMSGGRFELGIGRGVSPYELGYHGVAAEESPAMLAEGLALLLKALTEEEVTFEGRFWQCRKVPIVLRPKQQPHPPLWMPAATVEHAARAARAAAGTVCNGPTGRIAEIVARYRAEWTRPEPLPCIGLSRAMVIAGTREEARAAAQRAWRVHAESFLRLWRRHGAQPINVRMSEDFAEAEAAGLAFAGTPAEVRDALRRQVRETGVNYVVGRFAFGDLTPEEMLRSASLFAREIMPALAEEHRAAA